MRLRNEQLSKYVRCTELEGRKCVGQSMAEQL